MYKAYRMKAVKVHLMLAAAHANVSAVFLPTSPINIAYCWGRNAAFAAGTPATPASIV